MTEPTLELYAFWRSSATYRVRVALALKGLPARERYVDLDAGDQRDPAFLAINPLGAIPALIVPGQPPLTQSLAILEYLDETVPLPALLPSDPLGRARVRSIAAGLAADTHPLIVPRVRNYLTTTGGVRCRGVAGVAVALVLDRIAGAGDASGARGRDRGVLPWRQRDDGRHPADEHRRRAAGVQFFHRGHACHRSDRGALRIPGRVREGGADAATGRLGGLITPRRPLPSGDGRNSSGSVCGDGRRRAAARIWPGWRR
jgi:hypothetical protein